MAPLWTLGAIGIYVDGLERSTDAIWSEIDVIAATSTTFHYFGARSTQYRIRGHLWGTSSVNTLEGYCRASDTRTLAGPNALSVGMKVKNVTARRIPDKTNVTNEFWQVEISVAVA